MHRTHLRLVCLLPQQHQQFHLDTAMDADLLSQMQAHAQQSLVDQEQLEAEQSGAFDDFLAAYLAQ